jgi:hypothetical protein
LALVGCKPASGDRKPHSAATAAPSPPPAADASPAAPAASAEAVDLSGIVRERNTITVGGEPACALEVEYAGNFEQPVTWRGESCEDVHIRLVSLADLERIGQARKLNEEARDDLARMPGGQALYIEGEFASALYPANVERFIYEVPLAD